MRKTNTTRLPVQMPIPCILQDSSPPFTLFLLMFINDSRRDVGAISGEGVGKVHGDYASVIQTYLSSSFFYIKILNSFIQRRF